MKKTSLRSQLVYGVIVSMVVVMSLVGAAVYWVLKHESDEIFRARLNTSARVLEALITNQVNNMPKDKPIFIELPDDFDDRDERGTDSHHPYEQKIAFQVWNDMGVLLAKSASAPTTRLGTLIEGSQSVRLDDDTWEVFALRSGSIWVLAAEHNDVLEEKSHKLAYAVLTPFVLGTLVLILFVNIQVYRGLSPLKLLAQRIRSRNPASLEPLEEDAWPDELKTSVVALNDLLSRVKDAFEREQLFIDAAAHEMRTPVAGIQLHLQNAANTTDPAVRDQAMKDALEGVRRTTRLIEQMLTLSRTSHAKASGTAASYAMFDVICSDVVQALQRQLASRGQAVVIDSDKGVVVQAMPHQLTSIVQNLLENAAKYGDAYCTIDLSLRDGPDHVTLAVANQGKAIPAAERERIFRPHYRAPASERSGMDGCGLGLAIVQETVQQLGGHITLTDRTPGEGACFTVKLPVVAAGAMSEEV
jgi:two-component system, OmpR family, sensor histidine kinase QseC